MARWFARELADAGVAILSGFAVGVDAAAHRAALEVQRGRTVAVLGCGFGVDYPSGHRSLGARIAAAGAVLTEFPCERPPARWQFPVRNRLIAALADACLVIEAAPRSGSLVTARWALELGREVLAVPGRLIDELALGTNRLLADGARPALEPADVFEAISLPARPRGSAARELEPPPALGGERRALWLAARVSPAPPEALAARAGVAIERALALLLELELAGQLRRAADGAYEPFA
jgi:DNA processing protein